MQAIYVSEWDGGFQVRSVCQYDPDKKVVTDIEDGELDDLTLEGLDSLDREFVELPDGTELDADDGVTFDY